MVQEGVVLGHKIFRPRIKVNKTKIGTTKKLPSPVSVKVVRSILGHAGFYRCFIRDFSRFTRRLTMLLEKDTIFNFNRYRIEAFNVLKDKLVNAPIIIAPNRTLPFELMCDASDHAVGAVLGQRRDKQFHPIYSASKIFRRLSKITQPWRRSY